jgi:hypothetical protein
MNSLTQQPLALPAFEELTRQCDRFTLSRSTPVLQLAQSLSKSLSKWGWHVDVFTYNRSNLV